MNRQPVQKVSARARKLLAEPPMPEYFQQHSARNEAPYDAATRPDGYICLAIAENELMVGSLLEKLSQVSPPPSSVLGYGPMIGAVEFRERLADFLERFVLGRRFAPEQLAVLAGAGSVLEILFHNLCDPGEGVLVPTPSYAGFWADLETRDELQIVPVHAAYESGFEVTAELLDGALDSAGVPVSALLFTTPNNPLGRVYTPEEVSAVMEWAETRGVHLILDEIYALSVFGERAFASGASLRDRLGDYVHLVWAFSKDFGASGLRCGVLATENEDLLAAMDSLSYWACVSGHTQHLLGEVVADGDWVEGYVKEMQAGLRNSYRRVAGALDEEQIPYLPSEAGFFLLCDLRSFLAEPTWQAERALWIHILEEAGVNLTPGSACQNSEPGFFRLCFASVPPEVAELGVRRIGASLRELSVSD